MDDSVYRIHSTLEAPLADVIDFCESVPAADLPPELEDIEVRRRGNSLVIESVPVTEVGRYTPTATIKGTISDVRVRVDEEGEATTERYSGPTVTIDEHGEEIEVTTTEVEYVQFKGSGDAVLFNTAVRVPMFEVLCAIAVETGQRGQVEGIVGRDGELTAARVCPEGEEAVRLEVIEDRTADAASATAGVQWADNPYL